MKVCGVILAGGKSSRMGQNKALLEVGGEPVISRIAHELSKCADEIIVVANDFNPLSFLHLPLVKDRYAGDGPLAGIETAMYHHKADLYIFSACDMPLINYKIYGYLLDKIGLNDAIIPIHEERLHPLAGVYRRGVLPAVQRNLQRRKRKVTGFFDQISVSYESDFTCFPHRMLEKHFFNMNSPEQYENVLDLFHNQKTC